MSACQLMIVERTDRETGHGRERRAARINISFELPPHIEREISADGADLSGEAREAYLVELYRQDRITHHQLAEALELSPLETEAVL